MSNPRVDEPTSSKVPPEISTSPLLLELRDVVYGAQFGSEADEGYRVVYVDAGDSINASTWTREAWESALDTRLYELTQDDVNAEAIDVAQRVAASLGASASDAAVAVYQDEPPQKDSDDEPPVVSVYVCILVPVLHGFFGLRTLRVQT